MELETINKLFLELSQFATAETAVENRLKQEISRLRENIRENNGIIVKYIHQRDKLYEQLHGMATIAPGDDEGQCVCASPNAQAEARREGDS